jgi:hypothetical protein
MDASQRAKLSRHSDVAMTMSPSASCAAWRSARKWGLFAGSDDGSERPP